MQRLTLILTLLSVAACGSDPGGGTQTLYVEAVASTDGSSNGTSLTAVIRQGSATGRCVDTAEVVMIGERGTEHALPYVGAGGCLGLFIKNNLTWEPGWRLRIRSGADRLEGYLQAPGLTTITSPSPGQIFSRGAQQPLRVTWRDESGRSAQSVEVRLSEGRYEISRSEDPGHREIPHTTWTQAEREEEVRVTRTSQTNLGGGVTGSFLRASTRAQVQFQVQ